MANSVRKLRESIILTELWSSKKTQGSLSIVYKLNLNMNHHGLKLTVKFCCASGIAQIKEKQQEKKINERNSDARKIQNSIEGIFEGKGYVISLAGGAGGQIWRCGVRPCNREAKCQH